MDADSGFWEVKLDEALRENTTFITPTHIVSIVKCLSLYLQLRRFFRKQICNILGDCKGVVCMLDGILVVGSTQEEHDGRMEEMLEKLQSSRPTLIQDKHEFWVKEVKVLGHTLSGDGIKVDQKRREPFRRFLRLRI